MVVDEEGRKPADERCREQRERRLAPEPRADREEGHDRDSDTGRKAVDTVGQVDRVDAAHDDEHREDQIDEPRNVERHVPERDVEVARQVAVVAQERQIRARRRQLEHQLLQRREAEVALELHLDKIVDEADQAEHEREGQHIEMRPVADQHTAPARGHDAEDRRRDEHDAAHRGRPGLGVMPARADLPDGLPGLEGAERRNEQPAKDKRKHKRAEHDNSNLHGKEPFLYRLLSVTFYRPGIAEALFPSASRGCP